MGVGPGAADGRPFQVLDDHLQDHPGQRHQGAGIAGGNHRPRFTALDGVDRIPQRRAFAADRLGRFFVHGDELVGADDGAAALQGRQARQFGIDADRIAVQLEENIVARGGDKGAAGNRDGGAVIAAHGVDGDDQGAERSRIAYP